MKIQTLIIGLILLNLTVFSQTKIDDLVSIEIPGEVKKKNFTEANAFVKAVYSNSKTESYLVMRMAVLANGEEVNTLPTDSSELKNIYSQFIESQIDGMKEKGFLLLNTQKVKFNDYSAYKITYKTLASQNESAETVLICLNGVIYVFTYSRVGNYILQNKHDFQKSVKINSLAKQINYIPEEQIFSISNILTFVIVAIVFIILFFKGRNKSKYGINLKRVNCPKCQTKQPIVRIPKNERQTLWGGYTCNKCNTEMDKYGRAIT